MRSEEGQVGAVAGPQVTVKRCVFSGKKESLQPRNQFRGSRVWCHGRVHVASQGPIFPSALEKAAAKCPLGWDEPLAPVLPVFFPDRCSHSPACTCGLSAPHTLTWPLFWHRAH